ncbi:MAG TPA: response regulator transcription factor [Microbacteriaceae bacterium]|nr:response regulator transcription factor [Microbacteriaceae bacterium]
MDAHIRSAVIIEDDPDIRELLESVLEQAGFQAIGAANGADGIEAVRAHNPVVTTLDISMPGIDGFETAKRIREFSTTYIILLTARAEEIDVLQGLESGADDYITKPFRPRELRARIDAMLRRPRNPVSAPAPSADPVTEAVAAVDWHEHHGLRVNLGERRVTVDGVEVLLTRSEFDLLAALIRSGARVRTKAELAEELRGDDYTGYFIGEHDKRAVEVHLANLRKKLGESSTTPRWIETVRGVGYRLTAS